MYFISVPDRPFFVTWFHSLEEAVAYQDFLSYWYDFDSFLEVI